MRATDGGRSVVRSSFCHSRGVAADERARASGAQVQRVTADGAGNPIAAQRVPTRTDAAREVAATRSMTQVAPHRVDRRAGAVDDRQWRAYPAGSIARPGQAIPAETGAACGLRHGRQRHQDARHLQGGHRPGKDRAHLAQEHPGAARCARRTPFLFDVARPYGQGVEADGRQERRMTTRYPISPCTAPSSIRPRPSSAAGDGGAHRTCGRNRPSSR